MVGMRLRIVTAESLAHETPLVYLRKIDTAYRHNLKERIHSGNVGGVQEDFEPVEQGVIWTMGKDDKYPRLIPNIVCAEIPKMIHQKESLMKSIEKHHPQTKGKK